ncbi:hypothetical protein [Thiocystis violascens]|uniref:Uncharacterized protein n=1 Tax=Thiocystis violascens (strain ATCC 17096 / DSM 198 / 6111) TaxID=765911 RepID=I3YH14_THIV6|nr:hypothetical protein [Thiocystis violascens]AFL76282.1 hypothetical protein Thivi_4485 [Thiocystis violascens DSM 198]
MNRFPKDAHDPLAALSERSPAPDAPDLAPPSVALDPVFPLASQTTRLDLYEGAPGEVRANWSLQANDYVVASHDFPLAGGAPFPVLRLRRVGDDGGSEYVDEISLRLAEQRGRGDAGFRVGQDASRFEAELGLVNGEGGWLLLARSNRLEHAASLGLNFPPRRDGEGDRHVSDPTLDPPRTELAQTFPFPDPIDGRIPEARIALLDRSESNRGGPGAPSGSAHVDSAQHAALATRLAREILNNRSLAPADDGAPIARAATEPAGIGVSAIPTLVYGRSAPSCAAPLIEAELRIHGWAAPNTEIDLFGQRYRVGPGGRFQFLVRVDDPTLLKQALTLHPPPGLSDPRDD